MTRRWIESLNISRSQEGAAVGIFRFDSKAKMMMKKISIFTRCLSSKQRDHWSWNLEIKWNFTLYSYQLKRPVEAKKSKDFIDHYGEKRVAFLHFRCVDIASSCNDKKSFVHSLELLPRRHLYAQRAKQLDLLWSNSNARGARVIQRARLCLGRLSDKLFFVRHDAGDEDFMIHDLLTE